MGLLIELALLSANDSHMQKFLKRHMGKGANPTPDRDELRGSKTPTNPSKNRGKGEGNLRVMNEVKPHRGVPRVFYCKPVNDKGGPCHAADSDHRSGCVLQLKRLQHTKDGKTVNHQDQLRCTITCGFCGKCRHYEDECNIKSVRVINSNTKRLNARKTKLLPEPPRTETREVRLEAKGVAKVEPPTITPRGARQRPLPHLLPPRLTLKNAHMEIAAPRRSRTARRGDWPRWPNRSWLQGWT